jgi:hypothetical protein
MLEAIALQESMYLELYAGLQERVKTSAWACQLEVIITLCSVGLPIEMRPPGQAQPKDAWGDVCLLKVP